jgi:HSP20 family protein
MTIEHITVQLEGTTLTIAGERKRAHNGASTSSTYAERTFGPFQRSFTLPTAVQREAVHATYTHGVLTVIVPKADTARPRQIPVQAA